MNAMFLGLALVIAAPALKTPAKDEPPPIVGQWQLTEWLQNGQATGFPEGASVEFLADGKRLWRNGGGEEPDERGYKLVPKTSPAAIDLIRPAGQGASDIFPSIYKIEKDTLTIAIGMQSGERPKSFEPDKAGVWQLMVYKRVKKE